MIDNILFYSSIFIILSTLLPLVHNDFWIFRVFDYPRLQKLALNIGLIIAILLFPLSTRDLIILGALVINMIYLFSLILPFTRFGKRQVADASDPPGENNLKLLIANVFQENRKAQDYHQLIATHDPDIVLMVETNRWWQEQMDSISGNYPHQFKVPLENTYGMLFYSRLELSEGSVKYLVEDDIPSIETNVILKSGQKVKLYCLHPRPPVPQENPRSTERDKEILLVGETAKDCDLPVVVMGDLNDVAWSYTTELFNKVSKLLDPRRGRGFFNTFNAKYFFLRFPLDHIFCSKDFTLSSIERLGSCGSDHFPMCVSLQYSPKDSGDNEEPVATKEDHELAQEKIDAPVD
ncbi:endonuclease/exonuclease/phosphatase family protein [Flavitalea antarctica]